jgi:hypothetical protein
MRCRVAFFSPNVLHPGTPEVREFDSIQPDAQRNNEACYCCLPDLDSCLKRAIATDRQSLLSIRLSVELHSGLQAKAQGRVAEKMVIINKSSVRC